MRSAVALLLPLAVLSVASAGYWSSEALVDTGIVRAFDATADSAGVIWTAIAYPDNSVSLFCSRDFGSTWQSRASLRADSAVRQLRLLAGQGDSAYLFLFLLEAGNGGDLWLARINPDTGGFALLAVAAGPDTVDDFSVTLDRDGRYYIYCLYANEHRAGRTGTFTRSLDCGRSWEAGTDWWNAWDPSVSYTNGSTVHCAWRYALNGGEIHYSYNRHYGMSGYWSTYRMVSDSFAGQCFDPTVVQTDSSPESEAAVWVFYTAGRRDTAVLDLAYSASSDGGSNWRLGRPFGNSFVDEQQPCLAADRSGPNSYVGLCYSFGSAGKENAAVHLTYTGPFDLDGWLEPVKVSRYPVARLAPRMVYVPHAPLRLPGVLYSQQTEAGPWGVRFAAPWLPGDTGEAAQSGMATWPNPSTGAVQLNTTVTESGSYSIAVYDAAGRLVASVFRGRLEPGPQFWTWDRTSHAGGRVPAGTYFLRVVGPGTRSTRRLILL
jgi:hypothetical protein